jgi:uncharacterized membrane protein YgaE (UPF0421/DUF939 family)
MSNVVIFPSKRAFSEYRTLYQDKRLPSLLLEVAAFLRDRAENNPTWETDRIYWLFKSLKQVAFTEDMKKLADSYIVYAEQLMSEENKEDEYEEQKE